MKKGDLRYLVLNQHCFDPNICHMFGSKQGKRRYVLASYSSIKET